MENIRLFDFRNFQDYFCFWGGKPYKTYNGILLPTAQVASLHGEFGDMVFQHIARPNYDIWFSVYQILKKLHTHARADVHLMELSILIKNSISYYLQSPFGKIRHKQWQFNLMNATEMDTKAVFEKNSAYTTMDYHAKLPLIEALFEEYPDLMGPYLDAIYANKEMLFYEKHLYAPYRMMQLTEMIFNIVMTPAINYYLLDLCVTTLFSFAITCKLEMHSKNYRYDIKQEIDYKMNQLVAIIASDLQHFHGIKQYAKEMGMSVTSLKDSFKNSQNTTMKAFWENERYIKIFDKVAHSSMPLEEIAFLYGFPDGAAFSTCFKRKYKHPPSFYRKALGQ